MSKQVASFYQMQPREAAPRASWNDDLVKVESVICASNPDHRRAGRRLSKLVVDLPEAFSDALGAIWTWQSECLLTDTVARRLEKSGLTGFALRDVTVSSYRRRPYSGEKLWELVVTGWGGVAPRSSGVAQIEHCDECRLRIYSCFSVPAELVDTAAWDGSSLFVVWPLPRFILLSEQAADFFRKEAILGASVSLTRDMTCAGELNPGRLEDHFSASHAEEIKRRIGTEAFLQIS